MLKDIKTLLQRNGRETKIKEIAEELNVTPTKIKKLLSRYWQRGMNKNAMFPDYSKYGGKGKNENAL
ncbi:sigma-70 domain-containing protein [Bacillus sp. FSL W8-1127]|uniref:sigma-70 domain-containing protein n=1 Tax=Bacillus sp. FSL W8-1127 TaxID=2954710 RepID=UPI0030FBE36B